MKRLLSWLILPFGFLFSGFISTLFLFFFIDLLDFLPDFLSFIVAIFNIGSMIISVVAPLAVGAMITFFTSENLSPSKTMFRYKAAGWIFISFTILNIIGLFLGTDFMYSYFYGAVFGVSLLYFAQK